jgi:hypothetical protein
MRDLIRRPFVYIANLGNAPQVVTLGLDALLPDYPFAEVCVIHTDNRPEGRLPEMKFTTMHETVEQLDKEFLNPKPLKAPPGEEIRRVDYQCRGRYYQFRYRRVLIQREERVSGQLPTSVPVKDVETEINSEAAFRTIFRVVQQYKSQRAMIHFNLAGGRKSMSVFAMCTAQMVFEPGDKLWHVVSKYEFMNSRQMHDTAEQSRLISIPYIRATALNPVLGRLISSDNPYDIMQAQEDYLHQIDFRRKAEFLQMMDYGERQILVGVTQGLSNDEIGSRLKKPLAAKTVANKLTTIYEEYIVFLSDVPVDVTERDSGDNMRAFLAAEFGAYFQQQGERLEGANG